MPVALDQIKWNSMLPSLVPPLIMWAWWHDGLPYDPKPWPSSPPPKPSACVCLAQVLGLICDSMHSWRANIFLYIPLHVWHFPLKAAVSRLLFDHEIKDVSGTNDERVPTGAQILSPRAALPTGQVPFQITFLHTVSSGEGGRCTQTQTQTPYRWTECGRNVLHAIQ